MARYVKVKKVWKMLHNLGGCGAKPESWADGWDKAIDAAIRELESLPAADVQKVRHGKWEDVDGAPTSIRCSACKHIVSGSMYGYAHCPICGARMDGKDGD